MTRAERFKTVYNSLIAETRSTLKEGGWSIYSGIGYKKPSGNDSEVFSYRDREDFADDVRFAATGIESSQEGYIDGVLKQLGESGKTSFEFVMFLIPAARD